MPNETVQWEKTFTERVGEEWLNASFSKKLAFEASMYGLLLESYLFLGAIELSSKSEVIFHSALIIGLLPYFIQKFKETRQNISQSQ